jgi:hypothetical protein
MNDRCWAAGDFVATTDLRCIANRQIGPTPDGLLSGA